MDTRYSLKIKKINGRYLESLYKIGKEQFGGEFWFTRKFLKDAIKRKGIYFGAFDKTQLIGAIFLDINDRPKAWIFFFDVEEKYRHHGVGQLLIKAIEKSLPGDYYLMFVDFEETDVLAKKFYLAHGFKKVAKIKNWFGKNTFGLIYSRELN